MSERMTLASCVGERCILSLECKKWMVSESTRIMKTLVVLLLLAIFPDPSGNSLAAEGQAAQESDLPLEVFQMTQSLDELISVLKAQQAKQNEYLKLQTAISYLSFRSRSIEEKSTELRYKEEQREAVESNIEKIESDPDAWDSRYAAFRSTRGPMVPGQPKQSEISLQILRERLKDLKGDILALETEILAAKNELASYESFVQRKIGLIE